MGARSRQGRIAAALPALAVLGFVAEPAAQPAPAEPALPVPMPAPAPQRPMIVGAGAVLNGLDKVTARVAEISIPVNGSAALGTLRITVRACRKAPPEEAPEVAAFLEVSEARPGEAPVRIFSGWMFASSPALAALEHPVYDVWVTDCMKDAKAAGANSR